jgi:hypothetical protein
MDNGEPAELTPRPETHTRALVREYAGAPLPPSNAPSDAGGLPGPACVSR